MVGDQSGHQPSVAMALSRRCRCPSDQYPTVIATRHPLCEPTQGARNLHHRWVTSSGPSNSRTKLHSEMKLHLSKRLNGSAMM